MKRFVRVINIGTVWVILLFLYILGIGLAAFLYRILNKKKAKAITHWHDSESLDVNSFKSSY